MKWRIVTDSSCDYVLNRTLPENVTLSEVPFIISVDGTDFVDTPDLAVMPMVDAMEACHKASHTSCPAPGAWHEEFLQADNVIAITISSNLSGSYASAMSARDMIHEEDPHKNIFVLDSRSAGAVLSMYVDKAIDCIEAGMDFDAVVAELNAYAAKRHTIFALSSYNNLVKNGRVSKLSGFLAGKLKIWGIGIASEMGTIIVKVKTRGIPHVVNAFVEDMKENGFTGGTVVVSHCDNPDLAQKIADAITAAWSDTKIVFLTLGGLCSYYAERHGIILSY